MKKPTQNNAQYVFNADQMALINAAKTGDAADAEEFLFTLNAENPEEKTRTQTKVQKKGAPRIATNQQAYQRALLYAAEGGHTDIVQMLLDGGASVAVVPPQKPYDDVCPALMAATEGGHTEIVRLLLDAGASVLTHYNYPFERAAANGYLEIATMLLDRGANPWIGRYDSPMLQAAYNGHNAIITMMLDRFIPQGEAPSEYLKELMEDALSEAAQSGATETIRLLLDRGTDINCNDGFPIRHATYLANNDATNLLLDRGADLHVVDDDPLRGAVYVGHLDTVQILLERGADVHALDDVCMLYAATSGDNEMLELLLKHGADVHAQNDAPLYFAALEGHLSTVKLLLAHGANVMATGVNLATIIPEANRRKRIEKLLLSAEAGAVSEAGSTGSKKPTGGAKKTTALK